MADEEKKKPESHKRDEDPVGKVYDSRLIRRLGHYLRPYWIQATVSSLAVTLKSLSDVAGPYLVKVAIDRYLTGRPSPATNWLTRRLPADPYHGITQLAAIYLGALLCAYLFQFIQTYLMQWTGQKIMFDLRRDIFRHMQRMHIGFFDTHAVGRLVTRLTSDVDAINDMFTAGVLAIVDDSLNLTIMAALMLTINWRLALTGLFRSAAHPGGHAPLPRPCPRQLPPRPRRHRPHQQLHPGAYFGGMSVVQLFNREQRAYDDFEDVNRQHMIAFKDTIFAYALLLSRRRSALLRRHCAGHLAGRLRRAPGHGDHRHSQHVHPVLDALLAAHPGPER